MEHNVYSLLYSVSYYFIIARNDFDITKSFALKNLSPIGNQSNTQSGQQPGQQSGQQGNVLEQYLNDSNFWLQMFSEIVGKNDYIKSLAKNYGKVRENFYKSVQNIIRSGHKVQLYDDIHLDTFIKYIVKNYEVSKLKSLPNKTNISNVKVEYKRNDKSGVQFTITGLSKDSREYLKSAISSTNVLDQQKYASIIYASLYLLEKYEGIFLSNDYNKTIATIMVQIKNNIGNQKLYKKSDYEYIYKYFNSEKGFTKIGSYEVSHAIGLIGPFLIFILEALDNFNKLRDDDIKKIIDEKSQYTINKGAVPQKSYSVSDSSKKDSISDSTFKYFDLKRTEVGRFFYDIYQEINKNPFLRAFNFLFKASSSLAKAIDVRFGTGAAADLLERIEKFKDQWVIDLGKTQYSELFKERMKKIREAKQQKQETPPPSAQTEKDKSQEGGVVDEEKEKIKKLLYSAKGKDEIDEKENKATEQTDVKGEGQKLRYEMPSEQKPEEESKKSEVIYKKLDDIFTEVNSVKKLLESGKISTKSVEVKTTVVNNFTERDKTRKSEKAKFDDGKQEKMDKEKDYESLIDKNLKSAKFTIETPKPDKPEQKEQEKSEEGSKDKNEESYPSLNRINNTNSKNDYTKFLGIEKDVSKKETPTDKFDKFMKDSDNKINMPSPQQGGESTIQNTTNNETVISMCNMPQQQDQKDDKKQQKLEEQKKKEEQKALEKQKREQEEAEKQQQNQGEQGNMFGTIMKMIVGLIAVMLPSLFGIFGVMFLYKFIKKLFLPEVTYSADDIDYESLASMDEEKKNQMKSAMTERMQAIGSQNVTAGTLQSTATFAQLAAGNLTKDNYLVSGQNAVSAKSPLPKVSTIQEGEQIIEREKKERAAKSEEKRYQLTDRYKREQPVHEKMAELEKKLEETNKALVSYVGASAAAHKEIAEAVKDNSAETATIENSQPDELETA